MKYSKLAVIAVSLFAAASAFATQPAANGQGNIAAVSSVSGTVNAGQAGTSTSQSFNSQSATASLTSTANNTKGYTNVNAEQVGAVTTQGHAYAFNNSTGTGNGYAISEGTAAGAVQGQVSIHNMGYGTGSASTTSNNGVVANANQGSENASATTAGFDVALNYNQSKTVVAGVVTQTAGVTGTTTGYASGATNQWNNTGGAANAATYNNSTAVGQYAAATAITTSITSAPVLTIPSVGISGNDNHGHYTD
jgi:hypothetical protein